MNSPMDSQPCGGASRESEEGFPRIDPRRGPRPRLRGMFWPPARARDRQHFEDWLADQERRGAKGTGQEPLRLEWSLGKGPLGRLRGRRRLAELEQLYGARGYHVTDLYVDFRGELRVVMRKSGTVDQDLSEQPEVQPEADVSVSAAQDAGLAAALRAHARRRRRFGWLWSPFRMRSEPEQFEWRIGDPDPPPLLDDEIRQELEDDPAWDTLGSRLYELPAVRSWGHYKRTTIQGTSVGVTVELQPYTEEDAERVRELCQPYPVQFLNEPPRWVAEEMTQDGDQPDQRED